MEKGEGATARPRLVRRTDDRMVAGVCSGLAEHFGTDPLLFRLGFVAAGVLGGVGLVVYLVAWALVPASETDPGGAAGRGVPVAAIVLLALAGATQVPALVDLVNLGFPLFPGGRGEMSLEPPALAFVLLLAGAVLLRPRRETEHRVGAEGGVVARASRAARPGRPPRERSGLGAITLALVMLVAGGGAAGASAGWAPLDVGQLAALSLLLVGAGLVVGAWFGRARLLIVVGVLMVPVVLAASLIDFAPTGTIGSPYLHLERPGELENMRVLVGQTTLDLSEYPFAEGTEEARLRVAAGSFTVIVPHDVRVEARVSVEAGNVHVPGGSDSGLGIEVADTVGPEGAPKRLELEVVAGIGSVGVYRMKDPKRHRERPRDRERGRERPDKGDRRGRTEDERGGRDRARGVRDRRKS